MKDFLPSDELNPELKQKGFLVDSSLSRVGKLLLEKGVDCKIIETTDGEFAST